MKKTISFLLGLALLLGLAGCSGSGEASDKIFKKDGITLTLTAEFTETTAEGYTAAYESEHVAVFVLREDASLFGGCTLEQYAQLVVESNGKDCPVRTVGGLTTFTFDYASDEKTYTYFCAVYQSTDAFWLVQFSCLAENYGVYQASFTQWATSVRV